MTTVDARFQGRQGNFVLDAAFTVPAKGVTALFGPSGCGKTTVLRCVAGLTRMAEGYLSVNGRVWQDGKRFLPPHRRPLGYVFQEASLFPHLSVRRNLTYGQRRSAVGSNGLAFDEVIDLLGLPSLLDRSPERLSGGERQRVAIGRALLSGPEILLMDEPMAALDKFSKNEILPYLESLHEALSIPVFYVSHDISEVERLADQLVLMEAGRVQAVGPLSELLADGALPLMRLPDAASVFDATVAGYDADYALTTLDCGGLTLRLPGRVGETGHKRRLRIEASDVSLTRSAPLDTTILNVLPARLVALHPVGKAQVTAVLRLGDSPTGPGLLARITRHSREALGLEPGQPVFAQIKSVALIDRPMVDL